MNLFLVALSPAPIEPAVVARSLQSVASRLPYFNGAAVSEHASADRRLAAAWICHPPDRVGGVHYTARQDDVFALFSGRPIAVTNDGFDGTSAVDPRLYLRPPSDWQERLDGRFVVVRCDGGRAMTVTTDPVGAYRVFTFERDGIRWIGNNADVVAAAADALELDRLSLASLLAFGWSFGGQPLRQSVHRLAPNATHAFQVRALRGATWTSESRRDLRRDTEFDPRKAADVLVRVTQALMNWPDRPVAVSVTGGTDSRLTFAAAARNSRSFHARTMTSPHEAGFPNSADVRVARELCEIAGVPHHTEFGQQVSGCPAHG